MATRANSSEYLTRGVLRTRWTGLANGDIGQALDAVALADKSVHVYGTPGAGGTFIIEGSNNGSSWQILNDPQGNPLSFNAEGIAMILENTLYVRPRVTAGDINTNFSVDIISRSGDL